MVKVTASHIAINLMSRLYIFTCNFNLDDTFIQLLSITLGFVKTLIQGYFFNFKVNSAHIARIGVRASMTLIQCLGHIVQTAINHVRVITTMVIWIVMMFQTIVVQDPMVRVSCHLTLTF